MSNSDTDRTEQRLTALEIKASFSEDLLEELNQIIVRQQQQIGDLQRSLNQLAQQMQSAADGALPAASGPRDELPPHY